MATSSDIQYISAANTDVAASNRRVTETFLASADIAAGDAVCFDVTKTNSDRVLYVKKADTGAAATQQAIGICLDTIDVSEVSDFRVKVVVKGYAEGANVAANVTQGALLTASGTAGRAALYDADAADANFLPFAQALEDDTATRGDVWVLGLFS